MMIDDSFSYAKSLQHFVKQIKLKFEMANLPQLTSTGPCRSRINKHSNTFPDFFKKSFMSSKRKPLVLLTWEEAPLKPSAETPTDNLQSQFHHL
ncbi:hypothetical protein TNCV_326041 [Trichonephila clavipes]|nr:hypothetical protein TNCV_326041 [Trichonephila clavipes]